MKTGLVGKLPKPQKLLGMQEAFEASAFCTTDKEEALYLSLILRTGIDDFGNDLLWRMMPLILRGFVLSRRLLNDLLFFQIAWSWFPSVALAYGMVPGGGPCLTAMNAFTNPRCTINDL